MGRPAGQIHVSMIRSEVKLGAMTRFRGTQVLFPEPDYQLADYRLRPWAVDW